MDFDALKSRGVKMENMEWKKIFSIGIVVFFVIVILWNVGDIFGRNRSGIYTVKQSYWSGRLSTIFSPGIYPKSWGLTEPYQAATSYKFTDKKGEENVSAPPICTRFNDGGQAKIYGDVRFVLPTSDDHMYALHEIFGSNDELKKELYSQIVMEAVVMTAALMSSEESYATSRGQFSAWVEDQIQNGIYLTEGIWQTEESEDPNKMQVQQDEKLKMKFVVSIKRDSSGKPMRKEAVLSKFSIRAKCVINDIKYLDGLDGLITAKMEYLTAIVPAKTAVEKALQDIKTAEATGEKEVEDERYKALEQAEKELEAVRNNKEKTIIKAQQELEVAKLNYQAAEDKKEAWILKGKGEAERNRLIMLADGAISKKQAYYQKAWEAYRVALAKQRLVPAITTQILSSKDGLPQGIAVLNAIDQQLQQELGINLKFTVN